MPLSGRIAENVRRFSAALDAELARLGRTRESVTLIAVSKTFGPEFVTAAADCGLTHFGENRVQEARTKIPQVNVSPRLRWHMIGQLQTNKAGNAVELFDLIQSVGRWELAQTLDRRAGSAGCIQDILIQVNTTAEPQKAGCAPEALDELAGRIAMFRHLRIRGLMTIGPFVTDPGPVIRAFRLLRQRFEDLREMDLGAGGMHFCSMGMTGDWRIALAEGSNMLRIGRAIFGERG